MAKVDLEILIDPQQLQEGFQAGQKVHGKVQVTAHQEITCKGLKIALGWETSGSGNVAKDPRNIHQLLYQGNFHAGEVSTYDFDLLLPEEGPFEFVGKELIVFYYLNASAEIPMAFDPSTRLQIRVHPSPRAGIVYHSGTGPILIKPEVEVGPIAGTIIALIGALIVAAFFYFIIGLFPLTRDTVFFCSALVFLFLFCFLYFAIFANWFAQFKIEKPIFEVNDHIAPDGYLAFGAAITSKKTLTLNALKITLTCQEKTISGSGTNKVTHTNDVFKIEKTYLENEILEAGIEQKILDKIHVPLETPYYFLAPENEVTCKLRIHFDLERCPDYSLTKDIYILPQGYIPKPPESPN
ncbi:MAG: hypothetical protein AABZ60_12100 [Planctomycetota bacterium]